MKTIISHFFIFTFILYNCIFSIKADESILPTISARLSTLEAYLNSHAYNNNNIGGRNFNLGKGAGVADSMMDLLSNDGGLAKTNRKANENIDQARANIQLRIQDLHKEYQTLAATLPQKREELRSKNEGLKSSINQINNQISSIRATRDNRFVVTPNVLNGVRSAEEIRKRLIKEGVIPEINPNNFPLHEIGYEKTGNPELDRIRDSIYGKNTTLPYKKAIKEGLNQDHYFPEIRKRLQDNLRNGRPDSVFDNEDQLNAVEDLARTNIHYAKLYSDQNSGYPEKYEGISGKIAEQLVGNARRLRLMAQGFGTGLYHSVVDNVEGVATIATVAFNSIKSPVETYNKVLQLIECFDGEKFYGAVSNFIATKWDEFQEGDEEVKARFIGRLVGEIAIASLGGSVATKTIGTISKEIKIGKELASIATASKEFTSEFVGSALKTTRLVVGNEIGAIGIVSDVSKSKMGYESIKKFFRVLKDRPINLETKKSLLKSFELETLSYRKISEDLIVYRWHNSDSLSRQVGRFVTTELIEDPKVARQLLALPSENKVLVLERYHIKSGAEIFEGKTAPFYNHPGGGKQIFISDEEVTEVLIPEKIIIDLRQ